MEGRFVAARGHFQPGDTLDQVVGDGRIELSGDVHMGIGATTASDHEHRQQQKKVTGNSLR